MYQHRILASAVPDADQIYIQKLKDGIEEMIKIKDQAIQQENYNLADTTRSKITALKLQLSKLEESFHGDILVHYITVWQNGLAEAISRHVSIPNAMVLPFFFRNRNENKRLFCKGK